MRDRQKSSSATIRDVARKANVSVATVSRVYNSPETVRPETIEKVLETAQSLNYNPRLAARALTLKKTNIIGVILPDLDGEFFHEIIRSIDLVAWQYGYYIMISASHSQRNEVDSFLRLMSQGWVDGVIMMVPVLGRISFPLLSKIEIPIVLLNLPDSGEKYIQINVDNYRGAYLMTRHLLEHGYQPIAMIQGPLGNSDADLREQGFLAALKEYNLGIEIQGIHYLERGDFKRRSGYLAMIRLLSLPVRPRAVFAANDEMAIGAYNAIREHGLQIPEQIAIAGFDDINIASYQRPKLTTVHLPITELGMTAAENLIAAIERKDESRQEVKKIILPTGLVIRESCGCLNHN